MKRLGILLLGVLVLLPACGGGSGSSLEAFCEAYKKLDSEALANPDLDVEDPEQLQQAVEDTGPLLDDLADSAPAEIKDAVDASVEFYEEFIAILEKYDFDLNRVLTEGTPEELELMQQLGEASAGGEGAKALEEVQDYAVENCEGVDEGEKLSKAGSAIDD